MSYRFVVLFDTKHETSSFNLAIEEDRKLYTEMRGSVFLRLADPFEMAMPMRLF